MPEALARTAISQPAQGRATRVGVVQKGAAGACLSHVTSVKKEVSHSPAGQRLLSCPGSLPRHRHAASAALPMALFTAGTRWAGDCWASGP